ncbi:hypothetical protein Hoch_2119 [Haliangium ochraceum DSM 14365]|uniref:Lipoprotein n=2 Tax=Haliangium ochraceum TaxID=80816 RepID=D0LGU2_HALO1|nr:hypothetical protein Hoch_2119 [Haliangium ochraceum DSM 14365]
MRVGLLLLAFSLLGASCYAPDSVYSHSMSWACLSDICERADAVAGFDRAIVDRNQINLYSSADESVLHVITRIPSDAAPEGCDFLYGLVLFGHTLEPLAICRAGSGYNIEVAIPDPNPATASEWRIEMRPL